MSAKSSTLFPKLELATALRIAPGIQPKFDEHIKNGESVRIQIEDQKSKDKGRLCSLYLGNARFDGILLDLPRHSETYKTLDNNVYYKTNDVAQIIYIFEDASERENCNEGQYATNGLTPPMEDSLKTLKISEKSLVAERSEDVSDIEVVIGTGRTDKISLNLIVENDLTNKTNIQHDNHSTRNNTEL